MNQDRLLKKLDNNPKQSYTGSNLQHKSNKQMRTLINDGKYYHQHTDILSANARNIQTLQSIGTVNSQPDHSDQSFVIPDSVLMDKLGFKNNNSIQHNNITPRQYVEKTHKLDEQLTNIQKMKYMYESRQNRSLTKSNNKSNRSMSVLNSKSIANKANHHSSIDNNSIGSRQEISEECSNKKRSYSNSQQKIISNHKKHTLKPSCTPSFNKFVNNVKEQAHKAVRNSGNIENQHIYKKDDEELCRNIYLQEFLASSQNQHPPKQTIKNQKTHQQQEINQHSQDQLNPLQQSQQYQSSRFIITPQQPNCKGSLGIIDKPNSTRNPQKPYKNYQQSDNKNNNIQNMYLSFDENNASSFIQLPHQDQSSCNIDRYISPQAHQHQQHVHLNTNNTPVSNFNTHNKQDPSQSSYRTNYITKEQMCELIKILHHKYEELQEQVIVLKQQNHNFDQFRNQVKEELMTQRRQNQQLRQLLKENNSEKEMMKMALEKGQKQKEELEEMVKDVLYQRQKQKMHKISKQNTFKDPHRNSKENLYLQNTQAQTCYFKECSDNKKAMKAQGMGSNKMKVQNLLQKLHIKVDRT